MAHLHKYGVPEQEGKGEGQRKGEGRGSRGGDGLTIALASEPIGESPGALLEGIEHQARVAARHGIQLVCYPEWFIGIEPIAVDSFLDELKRIALEHRIAICGGNLPETVDQGVIQDHIFLVDSRGELVFLRDKAHPYQIEAHSHSRAEVGDSSELMHAAMQSVEVAVLNGLDVADESILSGLSKLAPDVVVIQLNPSSGLEAEAIRELALSISETVSAVVVVPVLASDAVITGAEPFAVAAGEIICSASDGENLGEGLLKCKVDPVSLGRVPHVSDHIVMPELLNQRLISELGGGTYYTDVGEPSRKS